jgi:hypothetical protein
MVEFTSDWRLANPLPSVQFAVALIPPGMELPKAVEISDTEERLVQPFPVAYGQWGLAPSLAGTVYQQRGEVIVPTNAAPGEYRVSVAVAPLYSNAYQGWADVGRIRIAERPRPRNGP